MQRLFLFLTLFSVLCIASSSTARSKARPGKDEVGDDEKILQALSDWDCSWNFKEKHCQPEEQCQYQYRFLDATLTESCRMKGSKVVKHLHKGWLKTRSSLLVGFTGSLIAADLVAVIKTNWLAKAPLLFNAIQGFVLFVAGDALFQAIEQPWGDGIGVKVWRMFRAGTIGAFNNGIIHFLYYKWIDRVFPYHLFQNKKYFGKEGGLFQRLSVAWSKYWIEYPTIGAYKILSMYFFTALLNGTLHELKAKVKKRFALTMFRALQIWPIYDTVLYTFVSSEKRPLFNAFMSIAWGGYLSHISQSETDLSSLEGKDGKDGSKGGDEDGASANPTIVFSTGDASTDVSGVSVSGSADAADAASAEFDSVAAAANAAAAEAAAALGAALDVDVDVGGEVEAEAEATFEPLTRDIGEAATGAAAGAAAAADEAVGAAADAVDKAAVQAKKGLNGFGAFLDGVEAGLKEETETET